MKKNNNKGFLATEALVVSIFVLTTLIVIFVQFQTITNSYNYSFKYDTVDDLYLLNEAKSYIKSNYNQKLIDDLNSSVYKYVDISFCDENYLNYSNYCQVLFNNLNIKKIIFTNENTDALKESLNQSHSLNEELISFIKTIKYDGVNSYRIIAEFNNNTYASLRLDVE